MEVPRWLVIILSIIVLWFAGKSGLFHSVAQFFNTLDSITNGNGFHS